MSLFFPVFALHGDIINISLSGPNSHLPSCLTKSQEAAIRSTSISVPSILNIKMFAVISLYKDTNTPPILSLKIDLLYFFPLLFTLCCLFLPQRFSRTARWKKRILTKFLSRKALQSLIPNHLAALLTPRSHHRAEDNENDLTSLPVQLVRKYGMARWGLERGLEEALALMMEGLRYVAGVDGQERMGFDGFEMVRVNGEETWRPV